MTQGKSHLLKHIVLLLFTFICFVAIEAIWFKVFGRQFFRDQLGALLISHQGEMGVRIEFGALAYFAMSVGLLHFVVLPAHNYRDLLGKSSLFGFVLFGTYEFTNHAVLKDWPLTVVLVDLAWGICFCSGVAVLLYVASRKIFKV